MTPERTTEATPLFKARIAGAVYVIEMLAAGFAEAVARGRLVVRGDAAATATNILAHESLFRLGGAADVFNLVCDIALAVLLYDLMKPVSRTVALLSTAYQLVGDVMTVVATLAHFAPLIFLASAPYLTVFSSAQLQTQAFAWIRLHAQAYTIAMVFFGFHCVLLGYLTYRSTFLPRVLGLLLVIAGVCYVMNSFARFVAPAFAAHLFPYILLPGVLAEGSLALWLLVFGVNAEQWKERAAVA